MGPTTFTELVGCEVPVQLAPMGGGIGSDELVRAVAGAGAMAMVAFSSDGPVQVAARLDALADVAALGANVLLPFMEDPAVVTAIAERGRLVDFYHASPDAALVERARREGVPVAWQVGTLDDARRALDAGVDLLVVRGEEGGGRLHGGRPLWPLLSDVLDTVDASGRPVPVLPAGGIASGRGLASALAAGAAGVRLGTVFVATDESGAHPRYKELLVAAAGGETVVTDEFSVWWPEGSRPCRVLRSALELARQLGDDEVVARLGSEPDAMEIPARAVLPPGAIVDGDIDAMALYAGDGVGRITSIRPAAEVVAQVVAEAEALLAGVGRAAAVSR